MSSVPHHERHRLVRDLFEPVPVLYWLDFTLSVLTGWVAFIMALFAVSPIVWVALSVLSVLALYRAVLFTHELVHLRREYLKFFRIVWDVLCGIPLLVPSFLYDGVHQEHHFRSNYGTNGDGEYLPFGRPPRTRIILYLLSHFVLPPLIFVRFGILGPLSWIAKKSRMLVWRRMSSLSISPTYERTVPEKIPGSWIIQESLCTAYIWAVIAFLYLGLLPTGFLLQLYCVSVCILMLNAIRTLAAHRYANDGASMSFEEQLLDSVNITSGSLLTTLVAPVGLRYHALHHLFPAIPYHNLGKAHRRMVSKLAGDTVYGATLMPSIWQVLRELWWASGQVSAPPRRGETMTNY